MEGIHGTGGDDTRQWLEETRARCARLAAGYRLALDRLRWANIVFVVLPAVASTLAAVIAAVPVDKLGGMFQSWPLPPASVLAGLAAVLVTVHKALRCDEHQAECQRLAQEYEALAEWSGATLPRPAAERLSIQLEITQELRSLTKTARARLSTRLLRRVTRESQPA